MNTLYLFAQYALHLDVYLFALVKENTLLAYGILFLIIFAETGLVITPFLPGDSLLFAAGSIAANKVQNVLSIKLLFILLVLASIFGNKLNYQLGKWIGKLLGPRLYAGRLWLNPRHLQEAHAFYEKHGGKTIIFARFLPIIRTFAPFVAGISNMDAWAFTLYNIVSALLWVGSLLAAGYFLGSLPLIKANFSLFIYGIILVTLLPALVTFVVNVIGKRRKS